MDKKSFLLESIIKAYIKECEPIGSKQLKMMFDLSFSTASIRGYFKKLGDDGYLIQEHISSGRIPTKLALQEYWINTLDLDIKEIDLNILKKLVEELEVSAFIKYEKDEFLKNLHLIDDKFIVLEFNSFAISVKFNKALYKFLNSLIEYRLQDLIKIASEVGASEIKDELIFAFKRNYYDIFNYENLLKVALEYELSYEFIKQFENGMIFEGLKRGFYFDLLPSNHMGIVVDSLIGGNKSKLLIVGALNKDYEYLFKRIANG